jgi:hypothetical protein
MKPHDVATNRNTLQMQFPLAHEHVLLIYIRLHHISFEQPINNCHVKTTYPQHLRLDFRIMFLSALKKGRLAVMLHPSSSRKLKQ